MLNERQIAQAYNELKLRVEMAKLVGGISLYEAAEGKPIPINWKLDYPTNFFVPPDFTFSSTVH